MPARVFFALLLLVLLHLAPAILAEAVGPTEALRPTIDRILEVLRDEQLKGDANLRARREKIMEFVKKRFEFEEMSKRVLGREWRALNEDERRNFVELFSKLLEYAYIGKLEGYSGENIDFTSERIKGDRAEVGSVIDHHGSAIPVSYIMINMDSGWMVYDIVIEGVSLVRNYMEQFKPILRKDKYAGLLKQLEDKVRELEGQNVGIKSDASLLSDKKDS